jgi:hypothetical protein
MADSPAADVGEYLANQGHGSLAVDIWLNSMPDGSGYADNIIIVTDLHGTNPDSAMGGVVLETPNVQIRTRNNSRLAAHQKCYAVYNTLKHAKFTINGHDYWTEAMHQPGYLLADSNDRTHFVCNFNIRRRLTP